ncbi:ABC transporter substrate-binding protein [Methanoculleus sp. FWC-SCC1]|uniref:ABC transporter substrate-binding protein n=1 Tax=Methanoculleus frigidifontis TaxID=2584085 RepID=A0ABT8M804_9EURY|nr:ABC transporter substrate-binding protein [Methanoculleus sp. FWC-SCC1]MDN7024062.1 ABC transporter substrate-binding protein [Methanoculleus sp. FWC-SCC1]
MMRTILLAALAALLFLAVPVSAADTDSLPGDADGDGTLTGDEVSATVLAYLDAAYMGGTGTDRTEALDAAQVYAFWGGRPKIVTDSAGKTATLYRPLRRIVVCNGETLETLRSIGLDAGRVVAVDKYSLEKSSFFPEYQGKTNIGSIWSPDMEKIVTARPDAVFLYATISTAACDDIQQKLEATVPGIHVFRFDCFKPATYADEVRAIAAMTGREERGEAFIAFYESAMNTIRDGVPDADRPRVYFEYWIDYRTVARNAGYNEKIGLAGGVNPYSGESTDYPDIDPESVIANNPQVVVKLAGQGLEFGGYAGHDLDSFARIRSALLLRPGWTTLDAVKNNRVYVIHSDILGGAQHFIGTAYLAKIISPERFGTLDPQAIHQRYLTDFQGIDFDLATQGAFVYP